MKRFLIAGLGLMLSVGLASVAMAAETGTSKSVTGTLEDSFCYGTMGAHGASHQKCAIGCAKAGIPVSLVDSEYQEDLHPASAKECAVTARRRHQQDGRHGHRVGQGIQQGRREFPDRRFRKVSVCSNGSFRSVASTELSPDRSSFSDRVSVRCGAPVLSCRGCRERVAQVGCLLVADPGDARCRGIDHDRP